MLARRHRAARHAQRGDGGSLVLATASCGGSGMRGEATERGERPTTCRRRRQRRRWWRGGQRMWSTESSLMHGSHNARGLIELVTLMAPLQKADRAPGGATDRSRGNARRVVWRGLLVLPW